MRIACMGIRGIPARYGGFETFVEQLAPRLVARGHEVTVYNRSWSSGRVRRSGPVKLVPLPSVHTKHLDTITHTALSVLHGLLVGYDLVLMCGPGNVPLAWIPRLGRSAVVLNVDGADSKRAKWGRVGKAYLRWAERKSAIAVNALVADNRAVQDRFAREYGVRTEFIPYGASIRHTDGTDALHTWGLEPRRYILWVGRLEPETRVDELIQSVQRLGASDLQLVLVGDAPFAKEFKRQLRELARDDVVFTGYAFGRAYEELSSHAFAYVQTSPTSGTSPALLDQMGFGNLVIARGTETNHEVVADAGLTYDADDPVEDLTRVLAMVLERPALVAQLRAAAIERVRQQYDWELVADAYDSLFQRLSSGRGE